MKRNLTLKIGGLAVDLDSDALVLFNYTAERMDSPAAVKNSYSQQVTLPGTPSNDTIFGRFWRADRKTAPGGVTGPAFDALRRTPFTILAGGEVLESGYCKLDSVTRRGDLVTGYALTLYGGLGSFYYALSYAEGGGGVDGKRTLADLDYGVDLDFDIDRTAVAEAWDRLATGPDDAPSKWDVINFAPTYGGFPGGTFDAKKALFKPGDVGLPTEVDGKKPAGGGWSLCDLGDARTEWDVKDLRSYLQRPVLNIKKFIEACCDPANNGGWAVKLDPAFFNDNNPYFAKAWLTLPRLDSLTLPAEHEECPLALGPASVTQEMTPGVSGVVVEVRNEQFVVSADVVLSAVLSEAVGGRDLYLATQYTADGRDVWLRHGVFVQLVALSSGGEVLAVSKSALFQSPRYGGQLLTPEEFAELSGYEPVTVPGGSDPGYTAGSVGHFTTDDTTATWDGPAQTLDMEGTLVGRDDVTVQLRAVPVKADVNTASAVWMHLYLAQTAPDGADLVSATATPSNTTLETDTLTEVHSGATVTKQTLLSTAQTPAEVLFGYCKLFGIKFLTDKASNTVSLLSRGTFYTGEVTDLDARLDRSQDIETVPHAVTAKWYDFGLETAGAFADYYKKIRGRVYGTQRVNTGFEFDASVKDVLSGSPFKGAVEVLEQGRCFYNPTLTVEGTDHPFPAVFLSGGCRYTLYDGDGSEAFDTGAVATSVPAMNVDYKGYDVFPKAELCDGDGKALDGAGVLLFFRGMEADAALSRFALTDDTGTMAALNGGTPCWLLEQGGGTLSIPSFGRYLWDGAAVADSWDFGRPAEVDIPGVSYGPGTELYARYWAAFMRDRYDVDTRVVTAWADLRGLPVGEPLLRRFFRFDGALWALNKIIDFDITGEHLTKCEFVKVLSPANYD